LTLSINLAVITGKEKNQSVPKIPKDIKGVIKLFTLLIGPEMGIVILKISHKYKSILLNIKCIGTIGNSVII